MKRGTVCSKSGDSNSEKHRNWVVKMGGKAKVVLAEKIFP